MKLKAAFISMVVIGLMYSPTLFAEEFVAKIHRLGVDNGTLYAGQRYCEVIFKEASDPATGAAVSTQFAYYAIPLADEAAFPYFFAILKYAKERDQSVYVQSQTNWTRSDGFVFGRVTYAQ